MKFVVEYDHVYRRLVPRPPIMYRGKKVELGYSIRCAKFVGVTRHGKKIVEAKDKDEAAIVFLEGRRGRGEDYIMRVRRYRAPSPVFRGVFA